MATEFRVRDNIGYSSVVKEARKLDQDLRGQVSQAIYDARIEYGDDEHRYVISKIEKKLSYTDKSSTSWVRDLSSGFRRLFAYYQVLSGFGNSEQNEYWTSVGATLFYFINPFDIIPDHTPETGYVDDAFAFYYCVRELPEGWDTQSELELG